MGKNILCLPDLTLIGLQASMVCSERVLICVAAGAG